MTDGMLHGGGGGGGGIGIDVPMQIALGNADARWYREDAYRFTCTGSVVCCRCRRFLLQLPEVSSEQQMVAAVLEGTKKLAQHLKKSCSDEDFTQSLFRTRWESFCREKGLVATGDVGYIDFYSEVGNQKTALPSIEHLDVLDGTYCASCMHVKELVYPNESMECQRRIEQHDQAAMNDDSDPDEDHKAEYVFCLVDVVIVEWLISLCQCR